MRSPTELTGMNRSCRLQLMNILSGFADISLWQILSSPASRCLPPSSAGSPGYGTGALMPLVLVPMVGAEPVVPIIAISAMFSNTSRVIAFVRYVDWRARAIVLACAMPTCVLGAWGYTRLTSTGAALVIGGMLIASVPLRRLLKRHGVEDRRRRARRSARSATAWLSAAPPGRA